MKYTIKDSVFTNLFQDKKYLLQLYKALHPEDNDVTEDELEDITIKNVLTDNIYNDLGFTVGSKLVVLVEAQSTWTMNIIVRAFFYLAQTYYDYFIRTRQNYYKSKMVQMPRPEVYVIYTGDRKARPTEVSLAQEFFDGMECCMDMKVKIIYDGEDGDIINQYIMFTKICNEQVALYGRSQKAISETIRICKDKNVLKEYLTGREKEVANIMTLLLDQEEITRSYIESEIYEARLKGHQAGLQEGLQAGKTETAKRMLNTGKMSCEEIAFLCGLDITQIEELKQQMNDER